MEDENKITNGAASPEDVLAEEQHPDAASAADDPENVSETDTDEPGATPATPYTLRLSDDLAANDIPDDYQKQLAEFGSMAAKAGVREDVAQRMLDVYVDAAITMHRNYDKPLTGTFATEYTEQYLRGQWAHEYDANMRSVRRAAAQLGDGFKAWLDRTGLGNHPAALETLARLGRGELTMSKAEARKQLDAIRASADFMKPKSESEVKARSAKMRLLASIADGDESPPRLSSPAEAHGRFVAKQKADQKAAIQAEIHVLTKRGGPLGSGNLNASGRPAALKRYHELIAKL